MYAAPLVLALALAPAQMPAAKANPRAIQLQVAVAQRRAAAAQLLQLGGRMAPAMPGVTLPSGSAGLTLAAGGPGDESVLKAVKLQTTDDALLDFFRKRTPPAPARALLVAVVKQLHAAEPAVRDAAQAHLIAVGQAAVPLLRETANNTDDVEGSTRAKTCLQNIEGTAGAQLVVNAARLLAARKPAGAAKVLLGYLPYAEDDATFAEVEAALVHVAMRDGKPDPAVLEALKDKVGLRRGTAAAVLCQAGGAANYSAVRPLLKDERPSVRLKAALGLVGAFDAEAIPVLIDLLSDLPPRLRQQAEDYLTGLAGEWAVSGPKGNDLMSRRLRRDVWAAWWKNADGGKLLEEFRTRTPSDEDHAKAVALIARLDAASAPVRESASTDLINMGKKVAGLVRRAVNDGNPRAAAYAAKVLDGIEKDAPDPLPTAAPRLLALRRPEGAVECLVAYLPFAESEESMNQVIDILATIGTVGGKADEALVKALKDPLAVRRAGAASALCRGRAVEHIPALRELLQDKDQTVKLRTAQGLATLGEKDAVPALIGLLKLLPVETVWEVEDYLTRLAGDKAPGETVGPDAASRLKAHDAWAKWWKESGKTLDLARIDIQARDRGLYLFVENWNPTLGRGRVLEVDAASKVRWELRDLMWPNDAQLLRNGNVLIVEQSNRVTERTRAGKIVWDRYYPNCIQAERLRDGRTFLVQRNQLQILDRDAKSVFNHYHNISQIIAARLFRDGSIGYVCNTGQYIRLDRTGKQVKTLQLNGFNFGVSGAEVLPGDRVIACMYSFNKVVEFNGAGKQVWECAVTNPSVPFRLSNGHTILSSSAYTVITEIDRRGKVVKEWKNFPFKPYRVFRR
jgi:HEAT repeat protein